MIKLTWNRRIRRMSFPVQRMIPIRVGRQEVVLVAALLAVAGVATTAMANSTPFTHGDAQAVFNSFNVGRLAILGHGGMVEGAPADTRGRIGPGQRFNGTHYCATDWHVLNINLGVTNSVDGGGFTSLAEAAAYLNQLRVHYTLDGAPLATEVTPVKPMTVPELVDPSATQGWWQGTGAILPPDALSVGPHTEHVVVENLADGDLGEVTFYIDGAGTGACL